MAQYKVLQDIEADDKLLGPLSLRQFIYAIIVFVLGFVGFRLGTVAWYLAFPFVPPMIFFGLLAAPFGRDQPSEVWLLAKIRFFLKSRRRIWDQSGVKELVTITVPKKIERITSKGFSEQEVKSRLQALSATLDTRGWAVKNVSATTFQPIMVGAQTSDRLVDISTVAPSSPVVSVDPTNDILDEQNNPLAQKVDENLQKSAELHRQQLLQKVRMTAEVENVKTPPPVDNSRLALMEEGLRQIRQNAQQFAQSSQTPQTGTNPAAKQQQNSISVPPQQTPVTPPTDPGILKLVKNNDLNVATISRQANKKGDTSSDDGEVVISLR